MTVVFQGNGRFTFPVTRSPIFGEALASAFGSPPPDGRIIECLAMLILDDADPYDLGSSVAAAAFLAGHKTTVGGYFMWQNARRFRREVAHLGIDPADGMLCKARLISAGSFGRFVVPYHLSIDLSWPLRTVRNWYEVASPFLKRRESGDGNAQN